MATNKEYLERSLSFRAGKLVGNILKLIGYPIPLFIFLTILLIAAIEYLSFAAWADTNIVIALIAQYPITLAVILFYHFNKKEKMQ